MEKELWEDFKSAIKAGLASGAIVLFGGLIVGANTTITVIVTMMWVPLTTIALLSDSMRKKWASMRDKAGGN